MAASKKSAEKPRRVAVKRNPEAAPAPEISTRRTNHIRIRLAPAPRPAVEVTLDDSELAAIDKAAYKLGFEGNRSGLFRAIAWAAARDHATTLEAEAAFRAAATAAHMGIGEWLRWVLLSAIGESALCEQIHLAREAVKTGRLAG